MTPARAAMLAVAPAVLALAAVALGSGPTVEEIRTPPVVEQVRPAAAQQPGGEVPPTSRLDTAREALTQPDTQAPPTSRLDAARSAAAAGLPAAPETGSSTAPTVTNAAPAGSTTTAVSGAGGQVGQALAARDVGDVLAKSAASTGVEIQKRNAVVADPRVRGWRTGQYATFGDGGFFFPARLDLDTAVSKFDPTSLRDVVVVKGPYSVLYGPAFSVIDVNTLDSPRYDRFESHGRTAFGYQTNGRRFDALQSAWAGDSNWGFRATYNFLQGNDYRSGNGTQVPASYLTDNINFALGVNLTENSKLELKGLRVLQKDLEFPGLYFDVRSLDTSALSLRYTLDDQPFFDRLDFRTWYNSTAASGDTSSGAKQAFVQQVLFQSFNPQFPPGFPLAVAAVNPAVSTFADFSTSRFANRSIGYRLMFDWGPKDDPLLIVGTDLSAIGQGLVENIRLVQTQGPNVNTGVPVVPGAFPLFTQNQSIPDSNQVDPGLFVQGRLPVTKELTLRAGGRIDWVHSSSNPRVITGNLDLFGTASAPGSSVNRLLLDPSIYSVDPSSPDLTRNYTLLSGFLQAEYKLDPNWTALAAVGHAARAPTLTELYAAGPFIGVLQQGTSRLIGDPNLSPEKLTQFDIGVRAEYEVLQLGANAFYASVRDYITYDVNKAGAGLIQVVYTNTDRATLTGGEMFAQAELTAWVTPFATLSYVQGIDQTLRDHRRPAGLASSRRDDPLSGVRAPLTEPLPQIPPLESRLGFRVHSPTRSPWWQVEFSVRMVAGQNSVATTLDELPTPGFTTATVRGFVRLRERWLFTAGVENIGSKNYREHLDPISGNLLGVGPLFRPGTNFFFGAQATY
jgi:outer membrane receptor protein involved in Fe transport